MYSIEKEGEIQRRASFSLQLDQASFRSREVLQSSLSLEDTSSPSIELVESPSSEEGKKSSSISQMVSEGGREPSRKKARTCFAVQSDAAEREQ